MKYAFASIDRPVGRSAKQIDHHCCVRETPLEDKNPYSISVLADITRYHHPSGTSYDILAFHVVASTHLSKSGSRHPTWMT